MNFFEGASLSNSENQRGGLWVVLGPQVNVMFLNWKNSCWFKILKVHSKAKERHVNGVMLSDVGVLLFIAASLMWLLLYCLCPVPVVLTHSYHGVPLRGTSCSGWCTGWWASRTVGHAPPYTAHSGTAATRHSPRSTVCTCHSSCLAGHLQWWWNRKVMVAPNTQSWGSSVHLPTSHLPKIQLNVIPISF